MSEHKYFEINEIPDAPFKYVLSSSPIDYFYLTLSKEQLHKNIKSEIYSDDNDTNYMNINGFRNVDDLEKYIINFVSDIEEKPYTIRYLGIPNPYGCNCELVVIAKIDNNGTCFIFSNNKKYLESIKGYD